ncbi:hypothetical protein CP369_10960, partial [Lactobacillus sp. UMNPBX18]
CRKQHEQQPWEACVKALEPGSDLNSPEQHGEQAADEQVVGAHFQGAVNVGIAGQAHQLDAAAVDPDTEQHDRDAFVQSHARTQQEGQRQRPDEVELLLHGQGPAVGQEMCRRLIEA